MRAMPISNIAKEDNVQVNISSVLEVKSMKIFLMAILLKSEAFL